MTQQQNKSYRYRESFNTLKDICTNCGGEAFIIVKKIPNRLYTNNCKYHIRPIKYCKKCGMLAKECNCI